MKRLLCAFVILHSAFVIPAAHAQRAVQKNPTTGALIEGFKSGANTIEISATGTLLFNSGFTLTGGSHLKTALSLNNVANVDSTNASNITSGSLALARIAQSGATSGQVMAWNGTAWAPTTGGGGGLTIGTSAITGGTEGKLLIHGAGDLLAELATSAGGNDSGDSGKVPTFDASGNLTASQLNVVDGSAASYLAATAMQFDDGDGNTVSIAMPAASANLTWPTGTGTLALIPASITDNAVARGDGTGSGKLQGSAMSIADNGNVLVNGAASFLTPMLSLGGSGTGFASIGTNRVDLVLEGVNTMIWTKYAWISCNGVVGLEAPAFSFSDRSGPRLQDMTISSQLVLSQHNGTTKQRWQVANTHSSSTSYESFVVDWQTTSNTCRVGTVKGSGGGTARQMILQTDGTERIRISASGEIFMTLPTSAGTTGSLWNDGGVVKVAP